MAVVDSVGVSGRDLALMFGSVRTVLMRAGFEPQTCPHGVQVVRKHDHGFDAEGMRALDLPQCLAQCVDVLDEHFLATIIRPKLPPRDSQLEV